MQRNCVLASALTIGQNKEAGHAWMGSDFSDRCACGGGSGILGIAGFAIEIAKIIFYVAIVLFLISAVFGLLRGRTPTVP